MSQEDDEARPVKGEILAPQRAKGQVMPLNTPPGIPLIVQAKYWAARRKLEWYTKALAAETGMYQALAARERAMQNLERTLVQSEHLDDLRRIEELKIVEELATLMEASEVREFRTRALKAQVEAEAIEAERRLDAVKNRPTSEPKGERGAVEQAGFDIVQIRKDAEALRKTLVECYGGEDKLTDEDRALLAQLDLAIRNKVAERLENL